MTYAYHIPQQQNNEHLVQAENYLQTVYQILSQQDDLSPNNNAINNCLSALVSQLELWQQSQKFSFDELSDNTEELLIKLPVICSHAETLMEKWWARKILSGELEFNDFWYMENYQNLINAEYQLLREVKCQNIIFLGSGSLPLSAMMLAKFFPNTGITCIDYDGDACDLAYNLIKHTHQEKNIEIIEYSAEDYTYHSHDLIICASLLNTSGIYDKLHSSDVPSILIRDAESFYRYLYHPAKTPCELKYRETAQTQLNSAYINTSRYFERVCI